MQDDNIKKVLTKVINSENDTKKGEKSNKLKISDTKSSNVIYIRGFTR